MLDSYLRDVGYLTSDLMTGKSLPVLAAIALLPLDASLLGTMVLAGVFGGSCVTLARAWNPASPGALTWGMRFLNMFYSAYLSVAFGLHVVRRVGGNTAWLLPAFCVIMQAVPERPTTLVVLGTLTFCLFYVSVFETANFHVTPGVVVGIPTTLAVRRHGRELQASSEALAPAVREVVVSLGNSLVILLLTLYASACHGPVTSVGIYTQRYTSNDFLNNRMYGVAVCASAALTRAYTYLATAYLQDHALHVLLDGSNRDAEPWTSWLYLVTLVYSAAWACTQYTEQVLTAIQGDRTDMRAKTTVLLFILAYWLDWHGPTVFWATIGLCLLSLSVMGISSISQGLQKPSSRNT